ncbi:hypothetical protein [Aeromicrobium sp. UC242_57]|uniref:hypothetical protein n=1 Tax=Aeromicrobium sp. UC242_57 TaxID=3374624 RepID=UPI003796B5D1
MAIAADDDLASGSGWEVTQAPGGYLVTVDLDKKLPIVSDAPTIEVDGVLDRSRDRSSGRQEPVCLHDRPGRRRCGQRRGRLVQQAERWRRAEVVSGPGSECRPRTSRREPRLDRLLRLHRGGLQLWRPGDPAGRDRRRPR